jgi:dihydroorotase-like cyclic amidohydrolase
LNASRQVTEATFRSRSANSWLLGETLDGQVRLTVADGKVAYAA